MSRDQRFIPSSSSQAGDAQDPVQVLRQEDLDRRYLTLTRGGKVTLNLARLRMDLGMDEMPTTSVVPDIGIFAGAGTTGLVPNPITETGEFLRDDGEFAAPAGSGDMTKAVYDIDDDGIVDKAENIDDGAGNAKSAAQVKTHIDDVTSNPHAVVGESIGSLGKDVYTGLVSGKLQILKISADATEGLGINVVGGSNQVNIVTQGVPIAKLKPSVVGNAFAVTPVTVGLDCTWVQCPDYSVVCKKNAAVATIAAETAGAHEFFMRGSGASINLTFKHGLRVIDSLINGGAILGTSFPTTNGSPQGGQPFYRSDLNMLFYYDATFSAWLSAAEWTVDGWGAAAQGTGYLRPIPNIPFSATYGHSFRYNVVCVELTAAVVMAANATWEIYDDGSGTGDTISTTTGNAVNEAKITSGTVIAAASVIAFNQTSGTGIVSPRVRATFRRIAT